jgi:hypothetical protein
MQLHDFVNFNGMKCQVVEITDHLYAIIVTTKTMTLGDAQQVVWVRKEWVTPYETNNVTGAAS